MDAALPERSAGDADAVSGRNRRQEFFPEGRAGLRPGLDSPRESLFRGFGTRDFLFYPGERRGPEIYRQHGRHSDPHLVIARAESRQSRLAIVRYRSKRIHHPTGRARGAGDRGGAAKCRDAPLRENLGTGGDSRRGGTEVGLYLPTGADVFRGGGASGGGADTRDSDGAAHSGRTQRQGIYRLSATGTG